MQLLIKLNLIFILTLVHYSLTENSKKMKSCRIDLGSIKNNERFSHQLVLIKGEITCQKPQDNYKMHISPFLGRLITVTRIDNFITSWPINSNNTFKGVLRLKKGINNFVLNYYYKPNERASYELNLIYGENMNKEPIYLGMFLSKDSKLVFDMDEDGRLKGEKNGLNSALKRFKTTVLIYQSIISDILYNNAYGRKSFRLILDSNDEPLVDIFKSELTFQELKDIYDKNKTEFSIHIIETIKNHPLYLYLPIPKRNVMNIMCLVLDTYWNKNTESIILDKVQFNGSITPDPIFLNSELLFTWPEDENDLLYKFTDNNLIKSNYMNKTIYIEKNELMNIGYNKYFTELLTTVFEVDLKKKINFYEYFLSIKRKDQKTFEIVDESKIDYLSKNYVDKLARNNLILNSLDFKVYYEWKMYDKESYFKQIFSKDWAEIQSGVNLFSLKYEYQIDDMIVLYDKTRNLYVSLDSKQLKWGEESDSITNIIASGKWIE